jgi:hypothetical protein
MNMARVVLLALLTAMTTLSSLLAGSEGAEGSNDRHIDSAQIKLLKQRLANLPKGKILILWCPEAPQVGSSSPPPQEPYVLGVQLQEALKESGYDVTMAPLSGSPPFGVTLLTRTSKPNPVGTLLKSCMVAWKFKEVHLEPDIYIPEVLLEIRIGLNRE